MTGTVLSEDVGDGIRIVTMNRPHRLNAIAPELLADLVPALRDADQDPAVRCIVLTGAGRAFCSGDDLKDFGSQAGGIAETTAYMEQIQDVTRAIVLGDTPVVGAVHGWAVGGGLEWVINCDFAIAAKETRFFFPETSWGVFVTGGVTEILPRLVGLQKTRELILFGERFDAEQALAWGMLHRVVPNEEMMPESLALARRLAALPVGPVKDLKRILAGQSGNTFSAHMDAETAAAVRGFLDPETAQRIARFGS